MFRLLLVLFLMLGVSGAHAGVFTLMSDRNQVDGQSLTGKVDGAGADVAISDTSGYGLLYDFTGYSGLDLGSYSLRSKIASTTNGLTLNLAGGVITGSVANICTTNAGHSPPLTITNCASIYVGDIDTRGTGASVAATVTITHTNSLNANSVMTYHPTSVSGTKTQYISGDNTGAFIIRSTGDSLNARTTSGGGCSITILGYTNVTIAGNVLAGKDAVGNGIQIGTNSNPIGGSVTIGGDMKTDNTVSAGDAGNITVCNNGSFTVRSISAVASRNAAFLSFYGNNSGPFHVTGGGVDAHFPGENSSASGGITITNYSSISIAGSVSTYSGTRSGGGVSLTATGGVSIAGDIGTYTAANSSMHGGDVTVRHGGGLSVSNVLTCVGGSSDRAGGILIFAGDGTGDFRASGNLYTYGGGAYSGGNITITNYASAFISGGINSSSTSGSGGNLAISNGISCDIVIGGSINLSSSTAAKYGSVYLTTSGGGITLGNLDMGLVRTTRLDFATSGVVTGLLGNFVTNSTAGSGSISSPYVTTQQMLRVTTGKTVCYTPGVSGNAYLAGKTYKLADLNGSAGAGGLLRPAPTSLGTFYMFK